MLPATEDNLVARRTRELIAAFTVSQEIVAQLDLDHVLHSITERAQALFQAQATLLCLLQPDGQTVQLAACSGWSDAELVCNQSMYHGLTRQVIGNSQIVRGATDCTTCAILCQYGPGRCHATPLKLGETTLGALCVICDPGKSLAPDQSYSLQLLANAAAIAINNAQLAAAARQEAARAAAATEREQLAVELHDHLAQTLSFLNLKADRLHELINGSETTEASVILAQMKAAVATAYTQVRNALTGLRQPNVAATDLLERLADCLAEFRVLTGIAVDFRSPDEMAAFSSVVQTQIIQIVREALTNIQRHAQAQQVSVKLEQSGNVICFSIIDDGCGFDPLAAVGEHHLGLRIMRMRAERSGGRMTLHSAPGAGTTIFVELPFVQDLENGGQ